MIATLALLAALQAATPQAAPAATPSVTTTPIGTLGTSVVHQLPTGKDWLAMPPEKRRLMAVVSVEGLRLNPMFAACRSLSPEGFEKAMGDKAAADPASTTISITALAAYSICPDGH